MRARDVLPYEITLFSVSWESMQLNPRASSTWFLQKLQLRYDVTIIHILQAA